ncbi:MAG: MBL fold metallo-hydrolase [Haloarculaceae archaeon]
MAIGDVYAVEQEPVADVSYVDTGMYDTAEYGAVYVIDADRPAVVDSGIGTHYERILDALDEVGIAREELATIALTHVHLDHAGGAGFLAEACPNATVAVHESGARHLVDPGRLVAGTKQAVGDQWQYYVDPQPVPEDRIRELADGDRIDLGDRELVTHHAPGHAPHQVVFESPRDEAVFVADAAGIYVPAIDAVRQTSPPPNFDLAQCLDDVETIRSLEPAVLCYPHFGPAAADDLLAEYETVLPAWVESVAEKRAELGDDEAVLEYVADATDATEFCSERKARAEDRMNARGVLAYLDRRGD